MLLIKDLKKTFQNGTKALRGINLTVNAGEFVTILGPSGSGKTTLLRSINGLENIDDGEIVFNNRKIDNNYLFYVQKKTGMVFQEFNLINNLSSINNVFIETFIEVGVIGLLILFFGEILPKIYANRHPLIFSKIIALPIYFLDRYLLSFLNVPMSKITFFFESSLIKNKKNISVDNLSQALELTDNEETSVEEKKILKGIVNFGNLETRQIMCPRVDMFTLKKTSNISDIIEKVINKGFSRVPVYENNMDKILGVLYVKDLLPHLENKEFNWKF